MLRKKKNVAFLNRNFKRRLARRFHHTQDNVSLQLIEEFFSRIVMIIAPLVRSSHHCHHHFAVFPHLRVAHRRLELLFVLRQSTLES